MSSRKPSDRLLLVAVIIVFIASSLFTAHGFNTTQKTMVATSGGTLIEGIVGTPRFANPVLAITRADQDVVALVYSGLLRLSPTGELVPDLAESVTISEDGLVYNVLLRDNIYFHDGTRVESDDIAYTVALIQDPLLKSPLRGNWNDVTVEVLSELEINFVLQEPYTPFIENLTVGILPKHIWSDLSIDQLPFSQHNTEPVGSGPYQLRSVGYNKSGLIESFSLRSFPIENNTAKITNISLRFYQNIESLLTAFQEGLLMSTAAIPEAELASLNTNTYTIIEEPLPRVFSVFFNQNKSPALRDRAVRKALDAVVDREAMVQTVMQGYGVPTSSPIPADFLAVESASSTLGVASSSAELVRYAAAILQAGGWEQQTDRTWQKEIDKDTVTLKVALSSANAGLFSDTTEYLRTVWEQLGVVVTTALFEQSDLVQGVIRPRNYEALLFGTDMGRQLDFYPFWHSSQKDDPGLNIALYTNITTDTLLKTARTTKDTAERTSAIQSFVAEVTNETPAIFLFSPTFTYVVRNDVRLTDMKKLVRPGERFSTVSDWYLKENNVWPIFAN